MNNIWYADKKDDSYECPCCHITYTLYNSLEEEEDYKEDWLGIRTIEEYCGCCGNEFKVQY